MYRWRRLIAAFCLLMMSAGAFAEDWLLTVDETGMVRRADGQVVGVTAEYEARVQEADQVGSDVLFREVSLKDGLVLDGQDGEVLGVCDLKTAAFYTTNKDKYYHLNTACDDGTKYPISGEAAVLFGKRACPVCTKKTQPVYTGECEFVWNREEPMWELNGLDPETLAQVRKSLPEQFYEESRITGEKFDSIFYEVYNKKTGEFSMSYPWPENYAGKYVNMAYAKTFLLVDPTEESIEEFKRVCGGGVWVVAAKYGMTELEQAREEAVTLVEEYCETHPELDARWVGHGLDIYRNTVNLEIYGSDAQMLIDSVEFPLCVRAEVVYSLPTTMDFPEN